MADDFLFDEGTGRTGAADDVGGKLYQRVKISIGGDGSATDWPSDVGASGSTIPRVVLANNTIAPSANFNRPGDTTAYAANDAVANNTSAGSVTPMSFTVSAGAGVIRRVRVRKSDQTVATPTIRAWIYSSSPTPGAGDNAAFAHPVAACLGFIDVAVTTAGSDDAVGWATADIPFVAGTLYMLLQTLSVFTPANAETFTVDLSILGG